MALTRYFDVCAATSLRTACVLLVSACDLVGASLAADIVLRFGSINTEGTAPYDQALVPFARAIEEESGGRIEVALKPIGGYGKPADLFNMVERGDIEMAATVQGYNPGRFPQSSVMELPFMFPNAVAGTEAMMSLYREGLLSEDYASVKVLSLYVLPPYPIFTTGKKIQTVQGFPRPAHAHAEHHGRPGAGQARRGAARHSPQHDRRQHRQRLCRRDRLWLGFDHDDQGRRR